MIKPETHKIVKCIVIDPVSKTVVQMETQGIFGLYDLLDSNRIAAFPSPWGKETMYVDEPSQQQQGINLLQHGASVICGFGHSLSNPEQNFPFVGRAVIFKSVPNGEDMDTELTPEFVKGLIRFYEWKIKYYSQQPKLN